MMNFRSRMKRNRNGVWTGLALFVTTMFASCNEATHSETILLSHDLPWSVRMADSEMYRRGESFLFDDSAKTTWVYETAVFLKGVEQVWRQTNDEKYFQYIKKFVDSYVEADGNIRTYELEEYNIDHVNPGKLLLTLYKETHEEKYKKAAFLNMKQLETHPRTHEGGFWHKKIYPWQMWLDGIYMGAPFYAEFAQTFDRPEAFDDIANQIIFIANHTRDPNTGLFYHGWDESKQQRWADPVTGCSPNFWARAMGWYAMGIVDVLDFMPRDHPQRGKILAIFHDLARAVQKYQDEKTGLWYQVMDQGARERNFLEASASAMFVYALAKAVGRDYLDDAFLAVAEKGYQGLVKNLLEVEPNGLVNLTQVCQVAGLGGKPYRDGSYDYYVSTPVGSNDLKGVGAFIMASVEMERVHGHTENAEDWVSLFDGKSFDGWRGLGREDIPAGHWAIEDGCIKKIPSGEVPLQADGQPLVGGDLMTIETFENFELRFEWKISAAGNSGVKYNVSEEISVAYPPPNAALGFEYQILDDDKHPDAQNGAHRTAGALYDMIAPQGKALRPVGEFNQARIVLNSGHGEHWLNGKKVVEYDLGTARFDSLLAASKYRDLPGFADKRDGHIVLQDHTDAVWFRNIKIRRLYP